MGDKTVKPPTKPAPPSSTVFAEQQAKMSAELERTKKLNAEYEANNKRTAERLQAARRTDVVAFCDQMVKEGRLLPAQRTKVERDLLEADDVTPAHKFSDNGSEVTLTKYERDRREIAAWPIVVKFGEKLPGSGNDTNSELQKVVRFSEIYGDEIRKAGSTPKAMVDLAKKRSESDKNFTAASVIGESAAALVA
jgi:hypothetical protein